MAKRKKVPRKAQQAAPAAQAKPAAAPNPFERLHSRKKFSILGKRARGEQRPTGKLRSEAVEKVCSAATCLFAPEHAQQALGQSSSYDCALSCHL